MLIFEISHSLLAILEMYPSAFRMRFAIFCFLILCLKAFAFEHHYQNQINAHGAAQSVPFDRTLMARPMSSKPRPGIRRRFGGLSRRAPKPGQDFTDVRRSKSMIGKIERVSLTYRYLTVGYQRYMPFGRIERAVRTTKQLH